MNNPIELTNTNKFGLLETLNGSQRSFSRTGVFSTFDHPDQRPVIKTPQGLSLQVDRRVFVPTEESFELVSLASTVLGARRDVSTIVDVGTGTGVVSLSLGKLFPERRVYALDISDDALALAEENAKLNGVPNVEFLKNTRGEWINRALPDTVDMVVSNPPYIGDEEFETPGFAEMYPDVLYDPVGAIRTFDLDGLGPYLDIVDQAEPKGVKYIVFQCNADNTPALRSALQTTRGDRFVLHTVPDTRQKERFLLLESTQNK